MNDAKFHVMHRLFRDYSRAARARGVFSCADPAVAAAEFLSFSPDLRRKCLNMLANNLHGPGCSKPEVLRSLLAMRQAAYA